jgi:GTP-binding protein HflX
VIDAADPLREERIAQVDAVLEEIGVGDIPQLLVYNKIDRVEGALPRHDATDGSRERVWISARDNAGLDLLRDALGARLGLRRIQGDLRLPPAAGRLRARLHALGAVRAESHDEHGWSISLDLAAADAERLATDAHGEPLRSLLIEAALVPT